METSTLYLTRHSESIVITRYFTLILFAFLLLNFPMAKASASGFCKSEKATRYLTDKVTTLLDSACSEANNKHWLTALSHYQQVLLIIPDNQTALRNQVVMLSKLGATRISLWLAQQNPQLFSSRQWLLLKSSHAVSVIRWGKIPLHDESHRFTETETAIKQLEKLLTQLDLKKQPDNKWLKKRIRFDLIVALRDRWKMSQVLQNYKGLKLADKHVPAYVLAAVADAYLYLHQPEQAVQLYRIALQQAPEKFNWKIALFYALVEAEQLEQAIAYIDKLNKQEPSQRKTRSDGKHPLRIKPNPHKTETEILSAIAKAYANDYSLAQNKLENLLKQAPANQDIRNELATVYAWRGWFRQAEQLYQAGLAVEPKHLQLRLGHAQNLIAINRYQQAEKSIIKLSKFSFDRQAQRLLDSWHSVNAYEFRQQTFAQNSSGSTKGSLSITSDSVLFSHPLAYHYRLFAHYRHSQSNFPEGNSTAQREGMGLEYQDTNWLLSTELHQNQFISNQTGVKLNGRYQFDDHWSIAAEFDTPSEQTPLRALGSNIFARSLSAEINYRANENRQLSISSHYLDFTDGNKRQEILLSGKQNWLLSSYWKLFLGSELFYSHNKSVNAIYFNPLQDVSATIKLGTHILSYRDYNTTFYQHISLNPGMYWQQNYTATMTGTLKYEHQWQFGKYLELNYGIAGFTQVYDGGRENGISGFLNFNVRFL